MNKRLKKKLQHNDDGVTQVLNCDEILVDIEESISIKEESGIKTELSKRNKKIIDLRVDKVKLAKQLLDAYQKEEYMLGNIKNTLDERDEEKKQANSKCISIRKSKIKIARELIDAYQKEEYLLKKILTAQVDNENKINNLNSRHNNEIKDIVQKKDMEIKEVCELYNNEIKNLKEQILTLRQDKVDISTGLLNAYQKEEYLLKAYSRLLRKFEVIERRYLGLSNSKLGKLTLMLWESKKKLKSGGK